jgi:SAM-dependent methyltransferase
MKCVICKSENTKRRQKVVQCASCTHVYRDYGEINLEKYYTNEYRKNIVVKRPEDSVLAERNKERYDLVKGYFKGSKTLLEVGFGRGHFWKEFNKNEKDKKYYCCEIDQGLAKEAEKKGISVFKTKFQNLKTEKTFDVVASFDVLEHFNNPYEYKSKLLEVLQPEGLSIIQVPVDRALHSREPFDGHYHYFSKQSLEKLMNPEFEVIKLIKTEKGQVANGKELLTIFRRVK